MPKQEIGGSPEREETMPELGRLASGETVFDRPDSHLHDDVKGLISEALSKVDSGKKLSVVTEVNFGREIGKTAMADAKESDDIVYAQRLNRDGLTRFVKGRQEQPCSTVVIALRKEEENEDYQLRTAFIGHITPSEPWDEQSFSRQEDPEEAREKSKEFWSNHALVYGAEPIVSGTETKDRPW